MTTDTTDCESVAKSDDLFDEMDGKPPSQRRLSDEDLKQDIERVSQKLSVNIDYCLSIINNIKPNLLHFTILSTD